MIILNNRESKTTTGFCSLYWICRPVLIGKKKKKEFNNHFPWERPKWGSVQWLYLIFKMPAMPLTYPWCRSSFSETYYCHQPDKSSRKWDNLGSPRGFWSHQSKKTCQYGYIPLPHEGYRLNIQLRESKWQLKSRWNREAFSRHCSPISRGVAELGMNWKRPWQTEQYGKEYHRWSDFLTKGVKQTVRKRNRFLDGSCRWKWKGNLCVSAAERTLLCIFQHQQHPYIQTVSTDRIDFLSVWKIWLTRKILRAFCAQCNLTSNSYLV